MTGAFNNREVASAIWISGVLAYTLATSAKVRTSAVGVLRAFFHWRIQLLVWLMLLYSAACTLLLTRLRLWELALLKDTVMWFCFVAIAMMFRYSTAWDGRGLFGKAVADTVTITLALEFLANTFTFSLPVEMVVVPVVTLLAMMVAYGKFHHEYALATRAAATLLAAVGLATLAHITYRALRDVGSLFSISTVRSFALEPLLSLMLIPLLYGLSLVSAYEQVFLRAQLHALPGAELPPAWRRRIIAHAGLSLGRLARLRSPGHLRAVLGNHL